jgi:hypothetical protein
MEMIVQIKIDISIEIVQAEINQLLNNKNCLSIELQKVLFPNLCKYFIKD